MTSEVEEIPSHRFVPEERLLLDTNVWWFVYGPSKPSDKRAEVYSKALNDILKAKSRIYIDVLILSEFINRYARFQYNLLPDRPAAFKHFRRSTHFGPVALGIADSVRRILRNCTRIEDGFETVPIEALIDEYANGNSDFNDQILAALCRKEALTLVTDDSDFGGQGIRIITANPRLLSRHSPP